VVRSAAAQLALLPLDRLRVHLLRATMPVSSYFAGRRAERVAALGLVSILLALLGTAVVPLWMLAVGPIVLGVPHLLADLRYCVVRPGWHRRPALWVGVGLPLLAVALGAGAGVGFAAVAGVCAASEGSPRRRGLGLVIAASGAAACVAWGASASLVLVHLHNFVAVLLWWRWREAEPRQARLRAVPIAAFVLGTALIAAGGLDPGLDGPLGLRLVLSFCFAQSVHYLIWLRLVPEDDRDRVSPRSFSASWRALVDELGWALPCLALLFTLALVGWALVDLRAARIGYLRAVEFHVFLELAVLASLWVSGRGFVIPNPSAQS
jgi:hypothetical protein